MIKLASNTLCPYSNIAFQTIIDELNMCYIWKTAIGTTNVLVVESDAIVSPPVRPVGHVNFFIVTLVVNKHHIPYAQTFSDLVVSRSVSYGELRYLITRMFRTRVRATTSEVRGKKSDGRSGARKLREDAILTFLLQGYTLKQTAVKMDLPYQAVSRYKMKIVERSGFRNFNELLIHRLKNKSTDSTPS